MFCSFTLEAAKAPALLQNLLGFEGEQVEQSSCEPSVKDLEEFYQHSIHCNTKHWPIHGQINTVGPLTNTRRNHDIQRTTGI